MTAPANPIQFTTLHGVRPVVPCYGPDGGPFTLANTSTPFPVQAQLATFDGAAWESLRSNYGAVGLPSATRTASASFTLSNPFARGVIIFLNVTAVPAAPGVGGLQVLPSIIDPASGVGIQVVASPPKVTTALLWTYGYYPATLPASGLAQVLWSGALIPRTVTVVVFHQDAQAYTYSVGYQYVQ
jgi:hypothetical protein